MRVSEWTGDIHVSISAMQLSPKMSGGGPMVWRTDSVGERERARWSASVSLGLPLCPSTEGDSLLEGRASAVRQVFLSLSVVVVGRTGGTASAAAAASAEMMMQ